MDKFLVNEYNITNPKLNIQNEQIAFISDIHSDINKFRVILQKLNELKIHTLLIGGDLIDSTNDTKRNKIIKELLYELAKTMKIYIAYGNHDIFHYDKKHSFIKSPHNKFFESLTSDNIYVPQIPHNKATFNKWSCNDFIDIISFNLPFDYYWNNEDYNSFIATLDEIEKTNINNNKYNILLCHSPINIFEIFKDNDFLNQFDLILTGHMHSGLIPYFLRNQTYGSGLVGPNMMMLPKFAYGFINGNNNTLLTSGGVTKLGSNKIFNLIYPSEIEILNLKQDINYSFKRMITKKDK